MLVNWDKFKGKAFLGPKNLGIRTDSYLQILLFWRELL